jgi:hypothetical protein
VVNEGTLAVVVVSFNLSDGPRGKFVPAPLFLRIGVEKYVWKHAGGRWKVEAAETRVKEERLGVDPRAKAVKS